MRNLKYLSYFPVPILITLAHSANNYKKTYLKIAQCFILNYLKYKQKKNKYHVSLIVVPNK